MTVERPLGRDDLEIAPRMVNGELTYFVADPLKNEYQQLEELQYEVFRRLDGQRSIDDICKELYDTYELEVDAQELAEFIDNLGELNLLDITSDERVDTKDGLDLAKKVKKFLEREGVAYRGRGVASRAPHGRERRGNQRDAQAIDRALEHLDRGEIRPCAIVLRQLLTTSPSNWRARYLLQALQKANVGGLRNIDNAWWWRVPLTNPDRWLGRLERVLRPFVFNRLFLPAFLLLFAFAWVLVGYQWERLEQDLRHMMRFGWMLEYPLFFPLFFLSVTLSMALHELAHGVTCKHFGGHVREMGLLFAYGSPAAYCDISATYLFENRWHRVAVPVAGPIFTLAYWALTVVVYSLVESNSALGVYCVVSIPLIMVESMGAMLNPLVKNDTYYALTDALDYPNLRDDAFQYLQARVEGWLVAQHIEMPEEMEARRGTLLGYAIPGTLFTGVVIIAMLYTFAQILVRELHTLGLILSVALFWYTVARPVRRWFGSLWQRRALFWQSRRFKRIVTATGTALVLALIAPWPLRIEGPCTVTPEIKKVRAPRSDIIVEVLAQEGEHVAEGQPLLRLRSEEQVAALIHAEAELETGELELARLVTGMRSEERGVLVAQVTSGRRSLRAAAARVHRLRSLVGRGLASRAALEEALAAEAAARTDASSASMKLRAKAAAASSSDLMIAQSQVELLIAQRDAARRELEQSLVRSPADGYVLSVPGTPASELVGSHLEAGTELLRVRTGGPVRLSVEIPVTEPISSLTPGAKVEARLLGFPSLAIAGTLERVSRSFAEASQNDTGISVLPADVLLDEESVAPGTLAAGLSGRVSMRAGWHPVAWHIYLRVARLIQIDASRLLG